MKAFEFKHFNSVEELIEQARKDGACEEGIEWALSYSDLDTLIKECPPEYSYFAVKNGYVQFANCEGITDNDWAYLLAMHPELAEYCNLYRLQAHHWVYLLMKQPKFFQYCNSFWPWENMEENFESEVMEFLEFIPIFQD